MNAIQNIVDWNISRNLTEFNPDNEIRLLSEELAEFITAVNNDDEYEMVDALADLIVVAIGGIYKLGYTPEKVLIEVHKEISSRQGAINPLTGKWEKSPNQDLRNRYTADYSTCRSNLNI